MYYGTTWKPIMTWQSFFDHKRLRILEVFENSRDVASLIRSFIAPYYLVIALSHDRSVFARTPNSSPLLKTIWPFIRSSSPQCGCLGHDAIVEQTPRVQSRLGVAASRRRKHNERSIGGASSLRRDAFICFSRGKNETRFFASVLARIMMYAPKERTGFTLLPLPERKKFVTLFFRIHRTNVWR